MPNSTLPPPRHGSTAGGIVVGDVERAADALLREGVRPTIDKVRAKIGRGSPNTVNPLLNAWWKRLAARLDFGPAAFHRLPESVAHVAEALWMQALDEARRRAALEQRSAERAIAADRQSLEVRSHVLSLREGELEARLKDRERARAALESQVRELTLLLRKGEATRDAQARQLAALENQLVLRVRKAAARRIAGPRPLGRSRMPQREQSRATPNKGRPKKSPAAKRRR